MVRIEEKSLEIYSCIFKFLKIFKNSFLILEKCKQRILSEIFADILAV